MEEAGIEIKSKTLSTVGSNTYNDFKVSHCVDSTKVSMVQIH